jgi:hypothetical protein
VVAKSLAAPREHSVEKRRIRLQNVVEKLVNNKIRTNKKTKHLRTRKNKNTYIITI